MVEIEKSKHLTLIEKPKISEGGLESVCSDLRLQKKGKYFLLNKSCFLVKGAKRGAVYDLKTEDVYSLDEVGTRLVEELEKHLEIETAIGNNPGLKKNKAFHYLNRLQQMGIGKFRTRRLRQKERRIENIENGLDFIWLELTEGCNLRCLHCYSRSDCSKIGNEEMRVEDWEKVLKEAERLGCKKVQFIGGEPFIIGEDIFRLIGLSRRLGYEYIEVFTNGTLLNDNKIDLLRANEVKVAVTFYGSTSKIHDQITGSPGSFAATLENVKKMKAKGIPLRVSVIGMKQNQDFLGEAITFLRRKMGICNISSDLVRPTGRGCNPHLIPHKLILSGQRKRPHFGKVDRVTFARRHKGNSCFLGKIYVTCRGDVIPCPMAREMKVGNLREENFANILKSDSLAQIWGLSKDKIGSCRDCEYRYACFDCRPKAMSQASNLYAKPPDCTYDPYLGKWMTI